MPCSVRTRRPTATSMDCSLSRKAQAVPQAVLAANLEAQAAESFACTCSMTSRWTIRRSWQTVATASRLTAMVQAVELVEPSRSRLATLRAQAPFKQRAVLARQVEVVEEPVDVSSSTTTLASSSMLNPNRATTGTALTHLMAVLTVPSRATLFRQMVRQARPASSTQTSALAATVDHSASHARPVLTSMTTRTQLASHARTSLSMPSTQMMLSQPQTVLTSAALDSTHLM